MHNSPQNSRDAAIKAVSGYGTVLSLRSDGLPLLNVFCSVQANLPAVLIVSQSFLQNNVLHLILIKELLL